VELDLARPLQRLHREGPSSTHILYVLHLLFTPSQRLPAEGPVVERIRLWASYRAQTIARTIRGVAYYRKVLCELGADEKAIRKKYQVSLSLSRSPPPPHVSEFT
jgi:hypothetical protein